MSVVSPRPRWLFLLQPRWLCWHLLAVVGTLGMLWLGDWQLHRALAGNELSWAYTFEWPLFAIFGVYFWTRTIRDELRQDGPADGTQPGGAARPAAVAASAFPAADSTAGTGAGQAESQDAYLARLRAEVRGHGRWHGFR